MADDLSSFIEQQKVKLEKERADLSRNGNYTTTTTLQDKGERRKSPKGIESGRNHVENDSPVKSKMMDTEETGLPLGGYEKVQQKLKEERRLEYNKYLAEKNMRSTGKMDSILKEKDISPSSKNIEVKESGRKSSLEHSYEKDARDSPIPRSRRKGKENWDINDNYQDDRGSRQYPPKETYEDILRRKRADERRYRGDRFGYDGPDLDDELRLMKLSSRNYKYNSRSDGYLSRRYDDDFDDNEFGLPPRRSRRRRDRSTESKRVRFYDDDDYEDISENLWSKPRRRLYDYDDNEDMDDLYTLSQRKSRSRRTDRVSSAHEERTANGPSLENESIRRTKTDSEIRSQSAPLLEGAGIIGGGHTETREMKIKRQEKYKKELEEQIKQHEENKKKEKIERFSKPAETSGFDLEPNMPTKSPRSSTRTAARQDAYHEPLGNNGPSSRPPQHPSLYPSTYDDPYYYYGRKERGATQATILQDPLFKSSGYGVTGFYDADAGLSEDPYQEKSRQRESSRTPVSRRGQVMDHTHQPPGGYSNISGLPGAGQVSPEADKQSKRAAQQAYQEELKKQMELREKQKQKEKAEKEKYDRKMDEEIAKYDPWGKGGAGAPLRDISGQVMADLRVVQQDAKDGKSSVSPRNAPPSMEMRFDNSPPQQLQQPQMGKANTSPFGRSDPLKERQPHDDLKEKAKQEYQHYLKQQVEEKDRKKREEQEKLRAEEEREERRMQEQRDKMQREYLEEQEKMKKKEEEAKRQNEMLLEAQNAKKREAERKRKEMEDQRQEELRKKLEENLAAKKMETGSSAAATFRSDSPPIPTMRKKDGENSGMARGSSPPVPALSKLQARGSPQPRKPSSPSPSPSPSVVPQRQPSAQSRHNRIEPDSDVLSQLTALRQQLKNEEQKVQSQIGRSTATTKYSQMGRSDNESKRSKKDVNIFDRALTNKPGAVKKTESDHYSPADEFNRMKQEDTSSLAGEFRSRFPQPATSDSMLDLQQQEYLREQEDKLSSLKSGMSRPKWQPDGIEGPSRSKSKDSLLESESQFIAVEDPAQIIPTSQTDVRPRQPSARERRRWKQLEEMAKEPKPFDVYKPPTPGGFSLNSVTSFNVDDVAAKNEERLRRIEAIRRAGGGGESSDPDDVLKQFMSERRRPQTRASEASLEAETSYRPF